MRTRCAAASSKANGFWRSARRKDRRAGSLPALAAQQRLPLAHDAAVGKIVDPHGLLHARKRRVRPFARARGAGAQDVVHAVDIRLPPGARGADGGERLLEHLDEELLARAVAQAAAAVVVLHLLKVCIGGQVFGEHAVAAERIQIREHHVALDVAGVLDAQVLRVGEHPAVDLALDGLCIVAQIDAVAQRLAHLGLAVHAGQAALRLVLRDQRRGQHERLAVDAVELFHDLARLLDHGELVLADGDDRGVKGGDVRRLRDGVDEKAHRQPLVGKAAQLHLRLDGRVARHARGRDEVHVIERERMQRRQGRLDADRRPVRVDAGGQVVQRHVDDVVPDLAGIVRIVGERLIVRDEDVHLVKAAGVLQLHPPPERADIVPQVQPPGRAVAREDDLPAARLFLHHIPSPSFPSLSPRPRPGAAATGQVYHRRKKKSAPFRRRGGCFFPRRRCAGGGASAILGQAAGGRGGENGPAAAPRRAHPVPQGRNGFEQRKERAAMEHWQAVPRDAAVRSFFARQPAALPLYEAFAAAVLARHPGTAVRVQKTQIAFANRHVFACASQLRVKRRAALPDPYLVVTLGMPHPLSSPRVAALSQPYPGRWTAHIVIGSAADVDAELLGWVETAYAFAQAK